MTGPLRHPEPLLVYWEWQSQAACRGMDSSIFFHPRAERTVARENRINAAKAVCRECPVIEQCLDHAIRVREPYGIWGGLSEEERASTLGVRSLRYPGARPPAPSTTPAAGDVLE